MEVVKDRVAVVVGACDDVGMAIGQRLAGNGAKVIICDSDETKLKAALHLIDDQGGNAQAKLVDPTSGDDVKRLVDEVTKQHGRIDILINNVNAQCGKPVGNISNSDWETGIRSNLSPTFFFCREVIPKMQAQKYGRVVNISSIDYMGRPGESNYSAVKSALFGLTRSLALETARDAVTVNCVVKGDVASSGMSPEAAEKIAKALPVGRIGNVDDVAGAVGFFASDTSKYVTGQTLFVCGGKSAYYSMSI
jgi:3-oxoacyl-[acyl-carrier protein] reductase/2-[hydroxy(phenyl)methyl]-succinyl-CoA dehydrogenase BbsC subunit